MAFVLVTLVAAAPPAEAESMLPEPGETGSHARYLEELRETQRIRAGELLARYDKRIAEAPHDVVAAIERCRFLATAFYEPETDENPREEEREACVAEVERRFPDDPAARVFVVEDRWGDDARAAGGQLMRSLASVK